MTAPDHGVDLLLRAATDHLRPDVDHLVAGGISRGRSRRRRARIGTAVAAVVVCGVIGAAAAVVPQLGSPDAARDPGYASNSPTPTVVPLEPAQGLAVRAAQIPRTVDLILANGATTAIGPSERRGDEGSQTAHFAVAGMLTTVAIRKGSPTIAECSERACEELPDGTTRLEWGPTTADGVTAQGVTWWRRGYEVSVLSYNAARGKDSPPIAPDPALDKVELRLVAGSDAWFSGLPAS